MKMSHSLLLTAEDGIRHSLWAGSYTSFTSVPLFLAAGEHRGLLGDSDVVTEADEALSDASGDASSSRFSSV